MTDWRHEKIPLWDVTIVEHAVRVGPERKLIVRGGTQKKIGALNERDARIYAIRQAHRMCSIPLWKPCIRESWPHSSAVEHKPDF
jgi:hypothetical protein